MSPIKRLKPPAILLTTFSVNMSPILPSTMNAQASFGFSTTSWAFHVFKLFASIKRASMFGLSPSVPITHFFTYFVFCRSPPRILFLELKKP